MTFSCCIKTVLRSQMILNKMSQLMILCIMLWKYMCYASFRWSKNKKHHILVVTGADTTSAAGLTRSLRLSVAPSVYLCSAYLSLFSQSSFLSLQLNKDGWMGAWLKKSCDCLVKIQSAPWLLYFIIKHWSNNLAAGKTHSRYGHLHCVSLQFFIWLNLCFSREEKVKTHRSPKGFKVSEGTLEHFDCSGHITQQNITPPLLSPPLPPFLYTWGALCSDCSAVISVFSSIPKFEATW